MGRIERTFKDLKRKGEKALVAYFTAGFPCLDETPWILKKAVEAGVDILEVGVPFSDPTADGPTIQLASKKAIEGGTTLGGVLEMVASLRRELEVPIVLFSYYNPILAFGLGRFCQRAEEVGLDGLLVVDLPPEEASELSSHLRSNGIPLIRLVAPTTSQKRLKKILRGAEGFIYCISSTSVTGTSSPQLSDVTNQVSSIRALSRLPVVVGFGISTAEEGRKIASFCDGVVVGSALMRILGEYQDFKTGAQRVADYLAAMKKAIVQS